MNFYKELVKTAVSNYFGDEFNDSSNDADILECFKWAVNIISSMLSKSGNGRKLEFSSLFRQFSISEDCNRIGEVSSSTFLGIMMENMKMSKDANIIETLFKRNYVVRQKKNLIPTITGIQLIKTINIEIFFISNLIY